MSYKVTSVSGVAYIVPDFDNRPLDDGPIFMDDNARPHKARIVRKFRQ